MESGYVIASFFVKSSGRDENPFVRFLAGERADETLNVWPAYAVLPTFA
jgi:hypothetical protein